MNNDEPTLQERIHELGERARERHRAGDVNGACDLLDEAIISVIDVLDPDRAGQGMRFVPIKSYDGMLELPTVTASDWQLVTSDRYNVGPVYDLLNDEDEDE